MKIGVITFHKIPNYGAMLQAYALQTFLEKHGGEVVFIKCSYLFQQKYPFWHILLSRNFQSVKNKLQHNYNMKVMCGFALRLKETHVYKDYKALKKNPPDCDVYVVGSDQMWNPAWCLGYINTVFLNFGEMHKKRVSYAVSFGTTQWPLDSQNQVKKLMSEFDHVSVREQSGIKLVKELSGRESHWLPDPTLLFDGSFYDELMGSTTVKEEPYCFRYTLDWDKERVDHVQSLVMKGLNISKIYFKDSPDNSRFHKIFSLRKPLTVPEWLTHLSRAAFVITDSFHGTIFCILFRIPFIIILVSKGHKLEGMNERVISLLKRLGLENRMLREYDEQIITNIVNQRIDWDNAQLKLSTWRKEADTFFAKSCEIRICPM